jgi:hypothetical protein
VPAISVTPGSLTAFEKVRRLAIVSGAMAAGGENDAVNMSAAASCRS